MIWLARAENWVRYTAPGWLRATLICGLFIAWAFTVSVVTLHFVPK